MTTTMEDHGHSDMIKQASPEALPSLIKAISSLEVYGFDSVNQNIGLDNHFQQTGLNTFNVISAADAKTNTVHNHSSDLETRMMHSVSISMPPSPMETRAKRVLFSDDLETFSSTDVSHYPATEIPIHKHMMFHSQPIPTTDTALDEAVTNGKFPNLPSFSLKNPRKDILKDNRYNSFKTWSGKLERQLTQFRGKQRETETEENFSDNVEMDNVPVHRFFDALEGPELDTLRASEEILLPEDKQWPFLLRYPISSFGICLGISSQAIMWKNLSTSASMKFLHISLHVNLILWCLSVALMTGVAITYILKVIFYFEAVRREYYHPIRVNFFFAPWIALLFLALGIPPSITNELPSAVWYVLMTPILLLELKIYGQWMSGGQRRLSKVANPSNHLSIVGNFVGALLGASMGLKEGPIFFFAVGLAHYTVLFVTLYQRLPTNETLPKELHPVFFLFVAAPSVASMAWAKMNGSFDIGSRIAYFIALFLYISLAVRVNFFRGFKFSLAWWAYTFPMTGAAIATLRYSIEVPNMITRALSVILSIIATITVTALLGTTIYHAFVLRDLFPNDIAIAISDKRPKTARKWFHRRSGSSDNKEIEHYLKFTDSDDKVSDKVCSETGAAQV